MIIHVLYIILYIHKFYIVLDILYILYNKNFNVVTRWTSVHGTLCIRKRIQGEKMEMRKHVTLSFYELIKIMTERGSLSHVSFSPFLFYFFLVFQMGCSSIKRPFNRFWWAPGRSQSFSDVNWNPPLSPVVGVDVIFFSFSLPTTCWFLSVFYFMHPSSYLSWVNFYFVRILIYFDKVTVYNIVTVNKLASLSPTRK